jgi:nickel-type superoxide dismutase maturation protease
MAPTLRHGDRVLVRRGGRPVRPGDVVVARLPDRPLGVKRAVRRSGGGWWLEGDNPHASTGSEVFGPVPDAAIVGRVLCRYWPLRRAS